MDNKPTGIVDLHECIQGEGKYCGVPMILIRMSGCNLNCQFQDWICDSSYTSWNPERAKYSLGDVSKMIVDNPQISHVMITGGNPSYQPELLKQIVSLCKTKGMHVAIEDNGTMFAPIPEIDFVSMSPKLTNSTPRPGSFVKDEYVDREVTVRDYEKHEKDRANYESMKKWMKSHDYQLKFVISNEDQMNEALAVAKVLGASKDKVYFMPEGVTKEQLESRRVWLYESCIKLGVNYTDRLHIIVYDNKREA